MLSPDLLKAIIASLEGSEIARIVNIACLALSDRVFLDRKMDDITNLILFGSGSLSSPFQILQMNCISAIRFSFVSSILALGTIQAMLILRIWYLFPHNKFIQYGMIILWVFSVAISLAYTSVAAMGLRLPNTSLFMQGAPGCRVARPVKFWRMFMPSLGLHTILYIMTAVRALRNRRILKDAPVLKRLLRDGLSDMTNISGGLFFFVVFAIGSFLENVPQINIPVIFSKYVYPPSTICTHNPYDDPTTVVQSYLLAVTSIAMSRIMFSIHSLASHLGSETGWLLSNVELRRTNWRKGATEGELIVECNSYDDHDDRESNLQINNGSLRSHSALKVSRVGMFNDDTMWLQSNPHNF
ncbi:MAG: hypothetical protein NXY57DRAFT_1036856 [Lentinula lateritia]|nr:MAG: hypothetical protein NXY57DRAFT_1036856 [Lentinula lateritia]